MHKKSTCACFSVGTLTLLEQKMAIAQSMKAGVWMGDCEGLLHPDMENVLGHTRHYRTVSVYSSHFVVMNHKCFPLQIKSQRDAFFFSVVMLLIT